MGRAPRRVYQRRRRAPRSGRRAEMTTAARLLASAALVAAAAAIYNAGGPFREEAVCEADGRLVGVCRAAGACEGGKGAACGLPGSEELRCCAPAAQASPSAAGQRSRQECKQLRDSKGAAVCENFRAPADGSQVREGDFPYFAAIGYSSKSGETRWSCGGALISDRFVLTAATCARGSPSLGGAKKVRLGDIDLTSTKDDANAQEHEVIEVISHPESSSTSRYSDIALLKLAAPVKFTAAVRPACLYAEERLPVERAAAAGTGTTPEGVIGILNKVDLPIIPNNKCNDIYKNLTSTRGLPKGIDSTLICAGEKGKDTCTGDSGTPLVIKAGSPDCNYQIIGISSFGPIPCGNHPGVYTRVYSYLPWIEQIVWQ